MKIREAKKEDILAILDLMRELFLQWDKIDPMDKIDEDWIKSKESSSLIESRINNANNKYIVAEHDGELVGYGFATIDIREICIDKEIGVLEEMYLKPEHRKKGASKTMLKELHNWFKEKGAKWAILLTHKDDELANTVWKKAGYELYNLKYRIKL